MNTHRPSLLASVFFNCPETSPVLFLPLCQYLVIAKISRRKIRAIFYFWPVFAPKTAFLADFVIIEDISILFYQPKWMKIGILQQL